MTLRLRCRLVQDLNPANTTSECKTFYCNPEEGKKSSFIFKACNFDTEISRIEKPCHLILDCSSSDWIFGGLEIHSNSRNIEVYAVPEGKDFEGREYWQTHRGSKIENGPNNHSEDGTSNSTKGNLGEELYQTIVLPPTSKPTTIKSLHLKLLSLRPAKCTGAFVHNLKLKGRIPEATIISSSVAQTGSSTPQIQHKIPIKPKQISPKSTPSIESTEQVGKAISGLVMMIQTIQSNMESSIQSAVGEFSKHSFSQHQNWTGTIVDLENKIGDLKDSVEGLNENVKLLRKEVRLQHEQMSVTKDENNESKGFDLESIRQILKEERQLMAQELALHNKQILSQALEQLAYNYQPVKVAMDANEIGKKAIKVVEEESCEYNPNINTKDNNDDFEVTMSKQSIVHCLPLSEV